MKNYTEERGGKKLTEGVEGAEENNVGVEKEREQEN